MNNPQAPQYLSINFQTAHFIKSAAALEQCPEDVGAEIAFAGRSNAGKSSALNMITGQKKLARTSKTPGRTQLLNFFGLQHPDLPLRLVDLPGYGFAKVPIAVKQQWHRYMENYLRERKSLNGLILVMDIRHPLQPFDETMLEWASACQMPAHILLTKSDKLKRGPAKSTLLKVRQTLKDHGPQITIQLFSSHTKEGVQEARQMIQTLITPKEETGGLSEAQENSPEND